LKKREDLNAFLMPVCFMVALLAPYRMIGTIPEDEMQHFEEIPQEVIALAEKINWMFESITISQDAWAARMRVSRQTVARIRAFVKCILEDKQLTPLPNKLALMSLAMASRRNYYLPLAPEEQRTGKQPKHAPMTEAFSKWMAELEDAYDAAWEIYPLIRGEITEKRQAVRKQADPETDKFPRIPPNSVQMKAAYHR
jgi:hypothetical protein